MREVAFIKQNKDKWLEAEAVLNERKPISPDQMADYYVQLLGDLSFAQTYYPKSNTVTYLNPCLPISTESLFILVLSYSSSSLWWGHFRPITSRAM